VNFWHRFATATPDYLARHYWWAYLWPPTVWLFDHQPIINAILFGQYRRLLDQALHHLEQRPPGRLLQLTCVYGELTEKIAVLQRDQPFFVCDVAPIQLAYARKKLGGHRQHKAHLARMNAESLAFGSDRFSTVLIFFLLHEMPAAARERTLHEALRVTQPGGQIIVVEYAPQPVHHFLYRFSLARRLLTRLEPFLADFWRFDILNCLQTHAVQDGKSIECTQVRYFFKRFYRVEVYAVRTPR